MKTTFAKAMMHAPMDSWITGVCQRDSRSLGSVGMKF